jgi:site-specific DNA-methyltransferase (cytosine-N4-specific)
MIIILHEVGYPLMAYEKQLLKREIETFFQGAIITHNRKTWRLDEVNHNDYRKLKYLTFIKEYEVLGEKSETLQAKLEHCSHCPTIARRQRTRYSVNGLHEYKGKFNPQIVHSIINVLGVDYDSSRILDPFCGSGTTLLECYLLKVLM